MFREDFEFHDAAGPAITAAMRRSLCAETETVVPAAEAAPEERISGKMKDEGSAPAETGSDVMVWLADAERELKKIPFFVRGKAKRNTEKYAAERGVSEISIDTLYEAKAHFAR
jgi:light-independent protochlorophyllide reductase subunit B